MRTFIIIAIMAFTTAVMADETPLGWVPGHYTIGIVNGNGHLYRGTNPIVKPLTKWRNCQDAALKIVNEISPNTMYFFGTSKWPEDANIHCLRPTDARLRVYSGKSIRDWR